MTEKLTIPQEAIAALRRGNKIEAIKLMREKSGIGLAEAKAVVDAFENVRGAPGTVKMVLRPTAGVEHAGTQSHPGLSPGEMPRSGGSWKVAIVVGVIVLAAILWARLG